MAEESLDEWTVRANDAMSITMVTKAEKNQKEVNTLFTFRPTWTYPIVGEQETIFGHKELKLYLRYNASDMRPHLFHTSAARLKSDEDEVQDVREIFEPHLPPAAFGSKADFVKAVQNTSDDWHPPGELIETLAGDKDGSYEIWKGSLADPLVLALVNRIQILVSLFIEGGTPIATQSSEEREMDPLDRWTVYFLYQKRPRKEKPGKFTYIFAGYSTVYRFYIFRPQTPGQTTSDLELELPKKNIPFTEFPCRSRISQFIIIEPFQHKGNGQRLYSTIYKGLLEDPNTFEITVEDPNEAFDVLRDRADLKFLRQQPEFKEIQINTSIQLPDEGPLPSNIVNKTALETIRKKFKIAPRQFSRLTEMHLMSKLPESVRTDIKAEVEGKGKKAATKAEEHEYRLWKLFTKSRINAQNKEQLATLEPAERVQALKEVLTSVELEYSLLLSMSEPRGDSQDSNGKKRKLSGKAEEIEGTQNGKKRRVLIEGEASGAGADRGGEEDGEVEQAQEVNQDEEHEEFVEEMPEAPEIDLLSD
ncbi:histone acetyltransferase 1 [Gnomoniopsis smithogilvyi]|uniref:Histone acetyltransferase type B catalytic subunit n=1 Tax=Gnomoniopsis smithogilvyi TaxID=1191159 RepID=A0A9W8YVR8_9PEZI|nr:histone acetyltransferase 1 [Gnomoniopsis smithogilvyi]